MTVATVAGADGVDAGLRRRQLEEGGVRGARGREETSWSERATRGTTATIRRWRRPDVVTGMVTMSVARHERHQARVPPVVHHFEQQNVLWMPQEMSFIFAFDTMPKFET